jgi:hypothetical protein
MPLDLSHAGVGAVCAATAYGLSKTIDFLVRKRNGTSQNGHCRYDEDILQDIRDGINKLVWYEEQKSVRGD